jgi:hypothetical protein
MMRRLPSKVRLQAAAGYEIDLERMTTAASLFSFLKLFGSGLLALLTAVALRVLPVLSPKSSKPRSISTDTILTTTGTKDDNDKD